MTPLQRMSAAIDEQITAIYGSPPDRGEGARIARAALRALAEAELPTNIIGAAINAGVAVMAEMSDDITLRGARPHVTDAIFRAMCRAIAEDRG